jgi:drug/metabolite transporter (DMT)-like permease
MEQYWIYYAIAASLCIGFYWFAQKMKAEMPEQSETWFIVYSYVWMGLTWFIGMLFSWINTSVFNYQSILYAFFITVFYLVIIKTRLKSLKYLSSSTYFINYRIVSSLWLIIVGTIFFSETISFKEGLWIALWFVVFYLLLEKKNTWESLSDMKKWFLYLFVWSLAVMWVQWFWKDFALSGNDISTLMFIQWFFGIITAFLSKGAEKTWDIFIIQNKKQWLFLFIAAILFGSATMFNLFAYVWGDLAIVYKIISYSLFIPIILSIIIYKEQVTPKKFLAFALTILSIFLFI